MNRLICCLTVALVMSAGCARARRQRAAALPQTQQGGALVSLRPMPPALSTRAAVISRSGDALRRSTEGALMTHGSEGLRILARSDHDAIATERQFQQDGQVSDESMASLAQTLGADSLVLVAQTRTETPQRPLTSACLTDLQVVHVETGEIVGLAQEHSSAQRLEMQCVHRSPRCNSSHRKAECHQVDMECLCQASLTHAVQAIMGPVLGPLRGPMVQNGGS